MQERNVQETKAIISSLDYLRKLKICMAGQLPLLEQKGYLDLATCSKNIAASARKKVVLNKEDMKNVSSKSDVNIMLRGKRLPSERGSPSLVGRGIAKPYPQHYHQHPPLVCASLPSTMIISKNI